MRAPVDLPEDYWKALSIMATGLGKQSRQHLVEEILVNVVDQNPGLLQEARALMHADKRRDFNVDIKIDVPERIPDAELKTYRFFRHNGTTVEGVGTIPQEALKNATGKKMDMKAYEEEFERYEVV